MKLQGESKCAYCERKLESVNYGKGEQDVDHFRPKGSVSPWHASASFTSEGTAITVPPSYGGYHLLAYHPFNYAASCKPCNSPLKHDHFPIAGTYALNGEDPAALLPERPFLIYPLGDFDDDPEELITFSGVSPQPSAAGGFGRLRALVTIEFFALDDALGRKNLLRERAMVIVGMFCLLEQVADVTGAEPATSLIAGYQSPKSPHTSCARAFVNLHRTDRAGARAVFDAASEFVLSIS